MGYGIEIAVGIGQVDADKSNAQIGGSAAAFVLIAWSLRMLVRAALGPAIKLMADANSCYTPDRAIEFGRRLDRKSVV